MPNQDFYNRLYNAATGKALKVNLREYRDRQRLMHGMKRAGHSKQGIQDAVNYMSYKNTPDKLKSAIKDTAAVYALPTLAAVGTGAAILRHRSKKKKEKTASLELDSLYFEKQAAEQATVKRDRYLKDIDCEQCRYQGSPTNDGRCPKCGAICGVAPTKPTAPKDLSIKDLENIMGDVDSAYQNDQQDIWNRVYGG